MMDARWKAVRGFLVLHRVWMTISDDAPAAELVRDLKDRLAHELSAQMDGSTAVFCSLVWAAMDADTRRLYGDAA